MKTDFLNILKNKGELHTRGFLSLQKNIGKAAGPLKFNNIIKDDLDKLDYVEEDKRKLSLTQLKALEFEDTYIVNVICYTTNNPNHFDEATGKIPNNENSFY